jgi:hypothetical protein
MNFLFGLGSYPLDISINVNTTKLEKLKSEILLVLSILNEGYST